MTETATKPIEAPDNEDIEPTETTLDHKGIESRATVTTIRASRTSCRRERPFMAKVHEHFWSYFGEVF